MRNKCIRFLYAILSLFTFVVFIQTIWCLCKGTVLEPSGEGRKACVLRGAEVVALEVIVEKVK